MISVIKYKFTFLILFLLLSVIPKNAFPQSDTLTVCSTTLPKPILDNETIYDTIMVYSYGYIISLNVNLTIYHTWDADLSMYLISPSNLQIELSSGNGGSGDNYINTTFDDNALLPITAGSAPFTGSFRPEMPLNMIGNLPVDGRWILKVSDNATGDTGQFISWCILFHRSLVSGVSGNTAPLQYELEQNYPNPFNTSTKINFSIAKQSSVKITLYDSQGMEVKPLLSSNLSAGKYDLYFNANELASGVYFYSMYLDGSFFKSRKLVLLK
jgi:subtilisin-like proprotein convertase family protein